MHFSKESADRRRQVLSTLADLGVQARVYTCPAAVRTSREICLTALVEDLTSIGAERLVLERRETMDHLDDAVIKAVLRRSGTGRLTYLHASPYEEPLLWPPDNIGWAVGRGGDWRRRAEPVLDKVIELGA